ncbi:MAG: helix-turn-helix transcriptional regulator [Oscillospiraceae bacterium]|nr:helix-turn-helix transcriptional regulator [Oscillospiraceae bacterium]
MKNSLNVEIGSRVRQQRKLIGYTREQFAEALDISERFAADIELGNRGMSFSTLIRLCNLLSVSSDYILMGKEPEAERDHSAIDKLLSSIDDKYIPYTEDLLKILVKIINTSEKK